MTLRELGRLDPADPEASGPGGPGIPLWSGFLDALRRRRRRSASARPTGRSGPDHPMRKVTVQVAFEPQGWTAERRAKVAALFDSLAEEWHTRGGGERDVPLLDALERAEVSGAGHCLELGSGVGLTTALLAERFEVVHALDLSMEMLRRSPVDPGPRVRADSSRLPYPDGSASAIVCQNMLLFPAEIDRVLAAGGALVWVNTSGEHTPIHLTADEVDRALPGSWDVVASSAGRGTWAVARRTP